MLLSLCTGLSLLSLLLLVILLSYPILANLTADIGSTTGRGYKNGQKAPQICRSYPPHKTRRCSGKSSEGH
ncbi:hypothetical protein FKM82_028487 [Ascaphus truei]